MLRFPAMVISGFALVLAFAAYPLFGDAVVESQVRLLNDIKFLASDDLEGRGVGTSGLNIAAQFIKTEFAKAGLAVDRVDGDAFQKFDIATGSKLVGTNSLRLVGPEGTTIELKIGDDVEGCSFGGSGKFDGDIVFCGYGIDASDEGYNDFEGIDVEGKVIIVLRRNPRQSDPSSPFASTHGISRHADLRTKMTNAAAQKAAAVLFVNDPYSGRKAAETRRENLYSAHEKVSLAAEAFLSADANDVEKFNEARNKLAEATNQAKSIRAAAEKSDDDPLMKFGYAGSGENKAFPPAFHISIKTCDQILASLKTDLSKLEAEIDSTHKPKSMAVTGWRAQGELNVEKVRADVSNVIGVIDGEGPLADETIVIGAHYDHVGRGGQNSLAPGSTEIHNGADDNASGTVTLLELARRFGEKARIAKPSRRLVFIAFTGEELGLLGSARYCKEPVFPLDTTIAMLNMDMVGRLKDDKLIVYGTGTSPRWEPELKQFNGDAGFKLIFKPEGIGPSDHASFYAKKIPVLHFFTGEHADYHKPTDDWEKINIEGVSRVANLMEAMIDATLRQSERPAYVEVQGNSTPGRGGSRPYVGTIPEFGNEEPGYAISGVSAGGPAQKGGLKGGDRIVKLGPHPVSNLDDFDAALRKFAPGDVVDFTVIRDKQEQTFKVTLDPPR
ncbi:M28 family peptidase [Schlesneria sp. DSM 10557]|uniref:M28 family peptidase n=1 Tax=Schlesneria sp. DSM 10557 TaxID=3044399 RepID=UPI0035A0B632